MADSIDRNDPQEAARVFSRILPDTRSVRFSAELLAGSIRSAHEIAPASWSVTLFPHMVRLNVGQVDVITLRGGEMRLLVNSSASTTDYRVKLSISDKPYYPSVPVPSGTALIPAEAMDKSRLELVESHCDYVREAARRKRGSPFRRAYSPGVVLFMENLLGTTLPYPEYCGARRSSFIPEEVVDSGEYMEGATRSIVVNAYERNSVARRACIAHFGARCTVCDTAFGETYGMELEGFIHVHHLVPLSTVGAEYSVDPVRDLRPVCPNCHAVIHSMSPPLTIEQVKARLRSRPA